MSGFTHFDDSGKARMVDVSAKPETERVAIAGAAVRMAPETLAMHWVLTDRRVILPGGQRAIMLMELQTVRPLLGDVQLITRSGDKHLMKHLPDAAGVVKRILDARDRRAKRRD